MRNKRRQNMRVTSNMEVGIIDRVQYIALTFEDDTELRLGEVVEYDLDLDNIDYSTISFATAFIYDEILTQFNKKEIRRIRINFLEIDANDLERKEKLVLDMPCRMKIRRCRINGDMHTVPNMYVELEGMVM